MNSDGGRRLGICSEEGMRRRGEGQVGGDLAIYTAFELVLFGTLAVGTAYLEAMKVARNVPHPLSVSRR